LTQSAVAYRETESGNTTLSTGLRTHKGLQEATSMRIRGPLLYPGATQGNGPSPGGGQGMELLHNTDVGSGIQSFDREKYAWLDFSINARNINLVPQGGKVTMPAGSAQSLLGYWFQGSSWAPPTINQWYESNVTANFTTTGAYPWRIEWSTIVYGPAGASIYIGLGYDGTLQWASVSVVNVPNTNYQCPLSGVVYQPNPPPPGPHHISLWMYASLAGCQFSPNATSSVWVTEQRA
jgi:hypothetical protein